MPPAPGGRQAFEEVSLSGRVQRCMFSGKSGIYLFIPRCSPAKTRATKTWRANMISEVVLRGSCGVGNAARFQGSLREGPAAQVLGKGVSFLETAV